MKILTLNISFYPGSRSEHSSYTYEDLFIIFGGFGYSEIGGLGYLNDLWIYNIGTGNFKWDNGLKTMNNNGVYGTLGVFDSGNYPGSRVEHSSSLYQNFFIIFGGDGYPEIGSSSRLNDLWVYNIDTGLFKWKV